MTHSQLRQLITASFLSEKAKTDLLAQCNLETPIAEVQLAFDHALVSELKRREDQFQSTLQTLNEHLEIVNKKDLQRRETLETATADQLRSKDLLDLRQREKIWKRYDQELRTIDDSTKKQIHQAVQKVLLSITV